MDAKLKYNSLACRTVPVAKVAFVCMESAGRSQMAAGSARGLALNRDEIERRVRDLLEKPQTVAKARV